MKSRRTRRECPPLVCRWLKMITQKAKYALRALTVLAEADDGER